MNKTSTSAHKSKKSYHMVIQLIRVTAYITGERSSIEHLLSREEDALDLTY